MYGKGACALPADRQTGVWQLSSRSSLRTDGCAPASRPACLPACQPVCLLSVLLSSPPYTAATGTDRLDPTMAVGCGGAKEAAAEDGMRRLHSSAPAQSG
jgi:hypothetical protein